MALVTGVTLDLLGDQQRLPYIVINQEQTTVIIDTRHHTTDLLVMRGDVDIDVLLAGPLDEDDLGGGDDLAALEAQPHARHAGGAQDE